MKKKLISLLLAVVLLISIPLGVVVVAEETSEPTVNPSTGRVAGPKGDEDVACVVYGKAFSDAALKSGYSWDDFLNALKGEIQGVLSNEKLPEVELYLVNDKNEEYKLTPNAVEDAALASSVRFETSGILGWVDDIYEWIMTAYGWVFSSVPTVGELYKIYGVKDVPSGDYTLEVRSIDKDGYILREPYHGTQKVHVGTNHVNYVGYPVDVGSYKFDIKYDFGIFDIDWDVFSVAFSLPGVFLNAREPGFSFRSADLGDNALPGTEFLLVNRDETEKIVKAAYALGKDTFKNAMDLYGTEGFTWEELSILHNEVLKWDKENMQISIDGPKAYKLLATYWALVQASATDPLITFMSNDTDIRIPAMLSATADENGRVFFGEKNNVTLVWSLEILLKMGNVVLEQAEEMKLLDGVFPDKQTEAMVNFVIDMAKYGAEKGTEYWDENGHLIAETINDYVYPVFQNDSIMEYARKILGWAVDEDEMTPEEKKMLDLLPQHALLTKKMPAGNYLMFEKSVPEGYLQSPFFYTIRLDWKTENPDPATWCYATVGDLGILTPYFAEDFYTWLRNYDYKAEADSVLNKITNNETGTLISDTLSGNKDITTLTIAYFADVLYNDLGGNVVYSSQKELAESMAKYLYAHGRTAQNLLMFGNQVITKSKAVVTGQIHLGWTFYTATTSPRANSALKLKAILKGIENSIDTTDNNPITTPAKSIVARITEKIDTNNRIAKQTTELKNKINEALKKVASSIGKTVMEKAVDLFKTFLKWGKEASA